MRTIILVTILAMSLVACSGGESNRPVTQEPAPESDSAPEPDTGSESDAGSETALPQEAPWRQSSLAASDIPEVFVTEWEAADNRSSCALIAPASLGRGEGADVRRAEFSGGWGVAYDLRETRSAFGVAGTGADASEPSYDEWPQRHEWPDGSTVGYGPEGGSGPNQLAYLSIDGQDCLYNVWSRLGVDHLEQLLSELRFVE